MGTVPQLVEQNLSLVSEVFEVSPKIKDVEGVLILTAQPQIAPVAICILVSAALTKSTHSTQAWGCLGTFMHDNIKAFLYCLSSSFSPSSVSLSCYLKLKAVVPLQILSLGWCKNLKFELFLAMVWLKDVGSIEEWFYPRTRCQYSLISGLWKVFPF